MLQLNLLIDDVVEQGRAAGIVNTDQMRKTPGPQGYGRYIKLDTERDDPWAGAWFGVNFELWSEYRETPLWLMLGSWDGVLPLDDVHMAIGNDILTYADHSFPVHLPTGLERDAVLAAIIECLTGLAVRIAND